MVRAMLLDDETNKAEAVMTMINYWLGRIPHFGTIRFLVITRIYKYFFTKMLMGSECTVIESMLYSYKLGKGCADFGLKTSRSHMKCELYDKLGSRI